MGYKLTRELEMEIYCVKFSVVFSSRISLEITQYPSPRNSVYSMVEP